MIGVFLHHSANAVCLDRMSENDDWITVTNKSKRFAKSSAVDSTTLARKDHSSSKSKTRMIVPRKLRDFDGYDNTVSALWSEKDIDNFIRQIDAIRQALEGHGVVVSAISSIDAFLQSTAHKQNHNEGKGDDYDHKIEEKKDEAGLYLIGLGIGQISSSRASMLQFAYFRALSQYIQTVKGIAATIHIFDPVSTDQDDRIYRQLSIERLSINNKGKSLHVQEHDAFIYFMPHCPYQLYNNVLWSHWLHLDNILVIGNR